MSVNNEENWENYSVIGEDPKVGFMDFEDEKSLREFDCGDEGFIIVSSPFPFVQEKPQSALVGETKTDVITLENTTCEPVDLWGVRIYNSDPDGSFCLSLMEPPSDECDVDALGDFLKSSCLEDRVLQAKQTVKIWLACKPKQIGLHTSILHFDVGDDKIERRVYLLAEDSVSRSLAPGKPYRRPPRRRVESCVTYVKGPRVTRTGAQKSKNFLPRYPIPPEVRELINEKKVPDGVTEGLNEDNYTKFFTDLLVLEEIQLEENIRQHDMQNISLRWHGKFLTIEVPGLAEKRPSLVAGDYVLVKASGEGFGDDSTVYQGSIYQVEAEKILLLFDREFYSQHHDHVTYNVMFAFNRLNMRRCYQAVEVSSKMLSYDLLFPSRSRKIKMNPVMALNQSLNEEQTAAVKMILGCKGAPPYVIHGPPGTGKTVTIVEAILQLHRSMSGQYGARSLVCAASNSAADHVLVKLINMSSGTVVRHEIFRLNAPSRSFEGVEADILQYCYYDDMVFKCPPLNALLRYKIIVSTYMSASLLYTEGIPRGHFSHIFLDEAGQASEPETMVPMGNLCQQETVIVLAGDPLQLGPVIQSKEAARYGLGKSYLERLFDVEFYSTGDENYVTKLVRNYRCHEAILRLPSELFYRGELMACKKDKDTPLSEWVDLPQKDFPVLFVGIQGCDEREGNNPSWFNRFEISKVMEIIARLKETAGVVDGDVGVITPYRQQVMKMKNALEALGMEGVKVGSVEQFQGQEKRVIIISTVRSSVKHNEFDSRYNLGFLSNPRRFNVAATRARSLLIIVGNPHIITKDRYWDKLLRYCADNNSYQGCPLPPPENHEFSSEGIDPVNDWDGYEAPREFFSENCGEDSSKIQGIPEPIANGWDEGLWKNEKFADEGDSYGGLQRSNTLADSRDLDGHLSSTKNSADWVDLVDNVIITKKFVGTKDSNVDDEAVHSDDAIGCHENFHEVENFAGRGDCVVGSCEAEELMGAGFRNYNLGKTQIIASSADRGNDSTKIQKFHGTRDGDKSSGKVQNFSRARDGTVSPAKPQKFAGAESWNESSYRSKNFRDARDGDGNRCGTKKIPGARNWKESSYKDGRISTALHDAKRWSRVTDRGGLTSLAVRNSKKFLHDNAGTRNNINEVSWGYNCSSAESMTRSGGNADRSDSAFGAHYVSEPCFDESQWSDGWTQ